MISRNRTFSLTSVVFLLTLFGILVPVLAQNCSKDNPCATGCCSKEGWCGTGEDHCGEGNCVDTCDYKLQCDANNPCETGCCSKSGFCGLGPDYCDPDVCVSGCDAKAECDPGFGSEWSESSKCPLNVCCSEFGFCGTTKEFCGSKTVKHPSCDKKTTTLDRVVGYYESWASRRPCNAFWPEQIPLGVYTHINFAFAAIDPKTFEVRPAQSEDLDLLMRVTQLKTLDPDLKVLIALGGWTFNDPGPTQTTFSDIARSKENQQRFFKSLISFLSTHNLDGVDLDWEYPVADDRSGRSEDFKNFPTFMANLRRALDSSGGRNELSITLPASYWYLQHFDIVKLAPHVDFFNIMSYDLHGKWDLGRKWTGEFLDAHTNLTEIDRALELLWRNNIDSSKVVMGLAFYARAYTLADPSCVTPGCRFASGADKGSCSREIGVLLNNEIDEIVQDKGLSATFYDDAAVQVLHWDNQWLSYDDAKTLKLKVDYARGACLGGVMVWAISGDTEDGKYSTALGEVTHRTVNSAPGLFLHRKSTNEEDDPYMTKIDYHLQCKWSNCGEFCPSGWKMMTRDDQWRHDEGELMLDSTACTSPHQRRLCCPPQETRPTCGWYSFNGGKCKGECPEGYREVGSLRTGCRSGYQAACCTMQDENDKILNSTKLYEMCDWAEAPMCMNGKCKFAGSPWPTEFLKSTTGSGAAVCNMESSEFTRHGWNDTVQQRKYCCDTSNRNSTWGQCTWRDDLEGFGTKGKKCRSGCKSNEIKVAMEGGQECAHGGGGAKSYCCTGTYKTTEEVLVPALSDYESDLAAWVENPTCDASSGLDLYARSEQSKRDQIILKNSHYLGTLHLLAKVIRGYATGESTKTMNILCGLLDKYLAKHWENLTCKKITSWVNDKKNNPTAQLYSPEVWSERLLCNPDGWNALLSDKEGTHPVCGHEELTDDDYAAADGSSHSIDDGTLSKRWESERRALHQLEKRGAASRRWFDCVDHTGSRLIRWQSQPFPSVGDWDDSAEQVQNAIDLADWNQCRTAEVSTYNLGPDRVDYASEHLIEMDSIGMFLEWAVDPTERDKRCEGIDCDFVANFFNKESLKNAPNLPGLHASHQQVPIQRVMEMLGSEENTENFAILHESINLNKAQIWQNGRPRGDTKWKTYLKTNKVKALEIIRDSIAVYNYLRRPDIWEKFNNINKNVRGQMELAQKQYKDDTGDDVDLKGCWDAWLEQHMSGMVQNGKDWINKAIDELKEAWGPEDTPEDDPRAQELFASLGVILDELKQAAESAIDEDNFPLGYDDMDTSD